jgi:hypothetical protein
MNKRHTIAVTVAASILAAAIVIGGYSYLRSGRGCQTHFSSNKATTASNSSPLGIRRTTPVMAQPPVKGRPDLSKVPPMPANLPDKDVLRAQFNMLRGFLEMPPERLEAIHKSIEKILAMPPQQKQHLLALLRDTNTGAENQPSIDSAEAAKILAALPAENRALVNNYTKGFSKERRQAFIEGYAFACENALKKDTASSSKANPPASK